MTQRFRHLRVTTGALFLGGLLSAWDIGQGQERGPRPGRFDRVRPARVQRLRRMDANGDGRIAKDEFVGLKRFFNRLDANGDGFITETELDSMRRGRGFRDDGAPKVGQEAPSFKLNSLDGKQTFDLTSLKGKRPVVLFFGSYT